MGILLGIMFLDVRGKARHVEAGLANLHDQLAVVNRNQETFDDSLDDVVFPMRERMESHYVNISACLFALENRQGPAEIRERLVSDLVAVIARSLRYELLPFVAGELAHTLERQSVLI